MEEELKCPACRQLYNQPVLLPCFHAMCLACALSQQQPVAEATSQSTHDHLPPPPTELLMAELHCPDGNDSDQLSILSEADSGVAVSSSSSSSSTVGVRSSTTASVTINRTPSTAVLSLACPLANCGKLIYFDEHGAHNLPRYRAMQSIVEKFAESCVTSSAATACQLCPEPEQQEASVFCQQCQVFYCDRCRDSCHPARGPLAKHSLVTPQHGRQTLRALHDKIKVHFESNLKSPSESCYNVQRCVKLFCCCLREKPLEGCVTFQKHGLSPLK